MDRLPSSQEAGRAEIEQAARSEFGDQGGAFRSRQQHSVAKVLATERMRKRVRQKYALINLNAVLVALRISGLDIDLLSCRDQSRKEFRRGVNEVVEAEENRAMLG